MKPDEIKLRINNFADDLINKLFPNDNFFNKLKGATAKFWIKQNVWKLDTILTNFVDKDGEINMVDTVNFFVNEIFNENEEFTLDIQSLFENNQLSQYLPNKIIVFTKSDLVKLFDIPQPKPIISVSEEQNC
jgi:hypothetical protein